MKHIIYKYDRKNVFGDKDYTEDYGTDNLRNIKTAFRCFCNDHLSAIQIEDFRDCTAIFIWNSIGDFENRSVSVKLIRSTSRWGCDNADYVTIPISTLKKEVYKLYDKETGERLD